jgi:hypothetical protein
MQTSLPTVPTDQNIKSVDLAEIAESAKIVGGWQALADYATALDLGQTPAAPVTIPGANLISTKPR